MTNELLELEVFAHDDPTGDAVDVLESRLSPSALEEIRGPGGGDVSISVYDPKVSEDFSLIAYRNVLKQRVNGKAVMAWTIGKKTSEFIENDASREVYKLSGEGLKTWFNDAAIYPAGGLRPNSSEERSFNFSTLRDTWYDAGQWSAPSVVVNWGDVVDSPWRFAPENWPDAPNAKWVWNSAGTGAKAEGDCYFRYEWTYDTDAKYSIFAAADDHYAIYVDGAMLSQSEIDTANWSDTARIDIDLPAGDHVIGIRVHNDGGPAGLIASVFKFGDPDVPSSAVLMSYTGITGTETNARVSTATTKYNTADAAWAALSAGPEKDQAALVRQAAQLELTAATEADEIFDAGAAWTVAGYPDPVPGWSVGEIVLTLLAEAEARGIRFPTWLTPTFTEDEDSYGNAWPRDLEWTFGIGDTVASAIEKLEELACDLWIDAELDPGTGKYPLNMAIERGVDRSVYGYDVDEITVNREILIFEEGKNLLRASVDGIGEIKNAALLQTLEGWIEEEDQDTNSFTTYGRLEGKIETGATPALARAIATEVFRQKALPEESVSYEITDIEGHTPWVDFHVGDWVLAPNDLGVPVRRRVMSLSVEEDVETGQPIYSVEFDTILKDNEDKLSRWLEKMGGGTLGGQFANSGSGSSLPVGQPVITTPGSGGVRKLPVAPSGLTVESTGLWSTNGVDAFSEAHLEWNPVINNTDGSPTVPLFYEVWGRPTSGSDETYQRFAVTTALEAYVRPFQTGSSWTFRVRAANAGDAVGAWSDSEEHTMMAPNTPMDPPTAPTLSSSKGVLIVSWDGDLEGALTPPPQFRYVYAMVSPAGASTFVRMGGALQRDGRNIYISGLTVGDDYDVYLVAVDGLGLESDPSATDTHTLSGIDLGDLGDDVQDAIDAAEEAARQARGTTNMLGDNSFENNTTEFWTLETGDVTNVTTAPNYGARSLRADSVASPYVASRYLEPIEVREGEQYLLSGWARTVASPSGTTDEAVVLIMEYGSDPLTLTSDDDVAPSPALTTTYIHFEGAWTVPAGALWARPAIRIDDTGSTNDYLIDDLSLRMMIPNALIVDGAISASKIGAGEVVAGKLAAGSVATANLQAGSIVGEKISGGTILGEHIAAATIQGDNIDAGTITVINLEPGIGDTINISGNVSIVSATAAITDVQEGVDSVQGNFEEMRTYYDFGPTGAIISTPDSPFQLLLSNDRISMLELGVEVSYWNSGQMFVRSMVGEEVVLGNHKLEKYGTGTVVRAL